VVLRDLLDLSDAELDRLAGQGIISMPDGST
jgi:hypothetical protein